MLPPEHCKVARAGKSATRPCADAIGARIIGTGWRVLRIGVCPLRESMEDRVERIVTELRV